MTVRKPIVQVRGPKTSNLVPVWGDAFISAHIHDATAHDSDTATLVFSVRRPFPSIPTGTRYEILVGWQSTALAKTGIYTVQRVALEGEPESGHLLRLECRAADLADGAKTVDSAHWDNATFGTIVADVARKMGLTAAVDPALASIRIPYRARIAQEASDFLSQLADDVGGAVKFAGGKVIVTQRGSGRSASGASLPTLVAAYEACYRFAFDFDPRGTDAESITEWWDEQAGKWQRERDDGSGKGRTGRPHPWPSRTEARRGARARRRERARSSAVGRVEMPGDPAAVAGCPVRVQGFGSDADGMPWIAESIDHDIDPEGGWIMTVNLETKDGKEETDTDDDD